MSQVNGEKIQIGGLPAWSVLPLEAGGFKRQVKAFEFHF